MADQYIFSQIAPIRSIIPEVNLAQYLNFNTKGQSHLVQYVKPAPPLKTIAQYILFTVKIF